MIFSHLPIQTLNAYLKYYNILLFNGCQNKETIQLFMNQCIQEIHKKYDLYKKKPI